MSLPDFEALEKEVDNIDTQMAIRGKLSMDEVERLEDIANELIPVFYGGTDEHVYQALSLSTKIQKMLGREVGSAPEGNIDTTVCQLCGQQYTGTPEELDAWEKEHRMKVHNYPR